MDILLLVVGFSLIILIHEFGHFIAAKYVGIKVEQFAMGFGPAIFSWRKGLGFRLGSTEKEQARRIRERAAGKVSAENEAEGKTEPSAVQLHAAEKELGFGDTEYRWNWVPLGGYVKMLGQDDSKPGMVVSDPRSYTSKSVGARMLVISAGVIMNILFAGAAFMLLFMTGLNVPRAVVGGITPMAPAQMAKDADGKPAPLMVGDEIVSINGTPQHDDFRKIALNTALSQKGEPMTIEVKRLAGNIEKVFITPEQISMGSIRLLGIGISAPMVLEGLDLPTAAERAEFDSLPESLKMIRTGDRITAVNGQPLKREDYPVLHQALQDSSGEPVQITVSNVNGSTRQETIRPQLIEPALEAGLNFAGMFPRVVIDSISKKSSLFGKAQEGDVVVSVTSAGDVKNDPSFRAFKDRVGKAGEQGVKMELKVLRKGELVTISDVEPTLRLEGGKGFGVAMRPEADQAIVAATTGDSSAAVVPEGSLIKSVNGQAVSGWNQVLREMRKVPAGDQVTLVVAEPGSQAEGTYTFAMKPADATVLASYRYSADLLLKQWMDSRTTSNPLQAAAWGVLETRDSILQVYLTINRLFQGSVPFSGMMGPVGMFAVGTRVASQGLEYLLWFLAIISANLAVVNFLPVPVVDGGHFLFLIIEKIQGKPLSERTMVVAQYIGLAMILTLFVAVTYQDILRMITN